MSSHCRKNLEAQIEVQQKRIKKSICIVCCGNADYTGKNETLLTKCLIEQLHPPPSKNVVLGRFKIFDFCRKCTEMVEDLMQLQTSLDFVLRNMEEEKSSKVLQISQDFITKNIMEKKTEIKIQILKSQYLMGIKDAEEFRLLCIWDFCPRVKICKEECVHQLDLPGLSNNYTKSQSLLLPLEGTKGKYNDAKIKSEEIIMTQPKCTLPFFEEEETVVKYEPWAVQDLVDGSDDDSYLRNEYYEETFTEQSAGDIIVTQNAEPEPSLSILEMSVISITTSKNLQRTTKEIYNFIMNTFPFYKKGCGRKKFNPKALQNALSRCNFIKRVEFESLTTNTIVNTEESLSFIQHLQQKLDDFSFEMYPNFLKQLPFFRNALINWSITNSTTENILTDKFHEKAGGVYRETITCVETDANEVKIEHLVYSFESRDEDRNPSLVTEQLQHLTEGRTCQESQESILYYKNEPEIIGFSTLQESPKRERKQKHITEEKKSEFVVAAPGAIKIDEPEIIERPTVQESSIKQRKQKLVQKCDIDGNIYPRPAFSYFCLIAMALKNSLNGSLRVPEIYKFIWYHFPFFRTAPRVWKNSVRHNLSMHRCFNKITKIDHIAGKGCLWALNPDPAKIQKMNKEIQKFSALDPVAIRRAMFEPENLEKIIRGELKRDYSENDDDKEDSVPPPAPPVKKQSHRSRTNYLDSFSADTIIIPTNTATIIVSKNRATPHRPNILGNITSRPSK